MGVFFGIIPPRVIPSGSGWRWVRSRTKKQVERNGMRVDISKLLPSSASRGDTLQHVLWMFALYFENQNYTALWCEQGQIPQDVEPQLSDYRFLAPLMSPRLANEFWGSSFPSCPSN